MADLGKDEEVVYFPRTTPAVVPPPAKTEPVIEPVFVPEKVPVKVG